jgi:hypothetical protein
MAIVLVRKKNKEGRNSSAKVITREERIDPDQDNRQPHTIPSVILYSFHAVFAVTPHSWLVLTGDPTQLTDCLLARNAVSHTVSHRRRHSQ